MNIIHFNHARIEIELLLHDIQCLCGAKIRDFL